MVVGVVSLLAFAAFSAIAVVASGLRRADLAQRALGAACLSAAVSLVVLVNAFVGSDWSSRYVADHTRSGLSPLLRLAGLWAGPEGSLLLFGAGVALVALLASRRAGTFSTSGAATAGVGAAITLGFAVVSVVAASPFEQLPVPAIDGLGLQPVLEHPAMVWHPPILYAGLVGLLLPAILVAGRLLARDSVVGAVPTSVIAVPTALLTIGLATGARWAHVELGWGGYWAWDPIESAGLVAWLCGVAAVHLRRSSPPRLLALVLVLPGVAAIWATTLTRVGLVDSVHAFADRPALRIGLLLVAATTSLLLLGPIVLSPGAPPRPSVEETLGRRVAAAVVGAAAVIVAIGTYEPLVEAGIGGDALSIAGWFFARALWPVIVVGAIAVIATDKARWWPAVGALLAVAVTPFSAGAFGLVVAASGGATAASAMAAPGRTAGRLAHVGVGIFLIGVAGTMASTVESVVLFADQPVEVAGRVLVHRGIDIEIDDVTSSAVARVDVDGVRLEPRLTRHERRGVSTAEVAALSSFGGEFQLVLLDGSAASADYRVVSHPRMLLVWLGAAVIAAGLVMRRVTPAQSRFFRLRSRSWSSVEDESAGGLVGAGLAGAGAGGGEPVGFAGGGEVGVDGVAEGATDSSM